MRSDDGECKEWFEVGQGLRQKCVFHFAIGQRLLRGCSGHWSTEVQLGAGSLDKSGASKGGTDHIGAKIEIAVR